VPVRTPTRRHFLQSVAAATLFTGVSAAQQKRVRTVAGTGAAGYRPEIAEAALTPVSNPYGVTVGADEALYFCEVDTGYTRRMDLKTARVTTIAGNGQKGYAGDGGPAPSASMTAPHEIRFDRDRNLYIVERDSHVVRRVDARTGIVSTVAGTGVAGFSGDGGPAAAAQLRQPHSIAFDASGNLLICDIGNGRIRSVDMTSGVIATFAGTGERRAAPDDARLEGTPLHGPRSLDTDADGNVYVVLREGNAVLQIDPRNRRVRRVAGTGETGFSGDGGPALAATFNGPKGIACGADRSLYVVDTENHAIRRIDLASGTISTVLGTGKRGDGPDGVPLECQLARPHGVCLHRGVLYVSDSENHRIRVVA
jgi:sugar lactone lactonase YvrE